MDAIAKVVAVIGEAYVRNAEGELRTIAVGDVLLEGETLVTPSGSSVELTLSDGSPLAITDIPELTLTADLVASTAAGPDESAVQDETIDAVLAALEAGEDLGNVLDATAAGPGSGGPAGQGHSFIRLGRIVEEVSEFSGIAGTQGTETDAIVDENVLPVDAKDDTATTNQGEPVTVSIEGNDLFVEGEDVISITQPENGVAVLNDDDTVTYTPNDNFSGTDSFSYTAVNPDASQSDTAIVTITVAATPEPPQVTLPIVNIGDDIVIEGNTAEVTVSLNKSWTEDVQVGFTSSDGTAIASVEGGDYDENSGAVSIPAGSTSVIVTFATNEDNVREPTEFFNVTLKDSVNAVIGDGDGIVEIIDVYEEPTITIGDDTVAEGGTAEVVVSLSRAVEESVSVDFVSADGTAIEVNGDYLGTSGTLVFAPGQTELIISVITLDDAEDEPTENFFLNLDNAENAVIADSQGVVTILDDDAPPPPPPPPPPPADPGEVAVESSARVVDEENLAAGSNPQPGELSRSGSFVVLAEDGIQTLSIAADSGTIDIVSGGVFQAGSVIEEGVIQLTFTSISGPSANGEYTINVTAELMGEHSHSAPGEDQAELEILVTLTDINGQTVSGTASATVIDDVPEARLNALFEGLIGGDQGQGEAPFLVVDESAGQQANPEDTVADRISSADFSVFFANDTDGSTLTTEDDVIFGADGPGSVSYGLSLASGGDDIAPNGSVGVASGIYAVDENSDGQGEQIMLYDNGGVLEGRIGGGPADGTSVLYFTISVVGASGEVTLAQATTDEGNPISIWHPSSPDNHDDVVSLSGAGDNGEEGVTPYQINLTQTVTDADDDTDSIAIDLAQEQFLGQGEESFFAFNFSDDGPEAVNDGVFAVAEDSATDISFADLLANDDGGADGLASIALQSNASNGNVVVAGDKFVYTPNEGYEGSDSFSYVITDADGDTSEATVSLDIDPDSTPSVSVVYAGERDWVAESALDVVGSDAASNNEITSGDFDITHTGLDTTKTLEVQDKNGDYIDVTAADNVSGIDVEGEYGLLNVKFDGTDYSWSYELGGAETHPDIDEVEADDTLPESFAVRVTDTDDDIDNALLQIDVRDDGPAASADTDLIAGIDMEVVGNVITGESEAGSGGTDVKGADGATVTAVASDNLSTQGTVGNSLSGQYGDLELNSDGGYTYTRTSAPDVGGDDVFDYIITDDDGDTSTTTLTITVGVNEPPVVQPPVELEDVPEFELRDDGMASRSDSLQFTAGSTDIVGFVFSSDYLTTLNGNTDGIVGDEIVWSISEDGQKITGSLGGDPAVELTLTEGANDLVTVELKLLSPLANELAGGNNVLDLGSVGVIATDEAGLTVEGTFDIGSIDDVPEAGDFVDPEPIANLIGATTGILNNAGFESGADNWEDISITGPVIEGVSYLQSTTGSGDTLETTLTAVSTLDNSVEIFEVVVNANGDYSFTLIEPKASIIQNIDLTNLTPGGPTPWVETPGGAIEIEGNGSGVNSSTPGAGVENNLLDGQVEGVDEFLYFQFFDPGTPGDDAASAENSNFVDGVSFENNHPAGGSVTAFVRNSATNESTTLNITVGGNEPIVVEDVGFTFNEVTINWDAGKLRLTAADVETTILPEGQELTFLVEGTDGDGDVASDSFTVIVDPELGTESASLVDGVVEGMYFEASSGLSGYTDARGEFAFRSGDLVVFSIGNIVIGSVDADTVAEDGKVYLQEIAGVGLEDLNDEYVENMAVFLQSLDNDGDAGNGIVINEGIHAAFSNDSIDLASITESELAAVLVENGYTPVTESDAMQHVREMLAQHAGVTEFEEHIDDGLALLASGDDDVFAFSLNEENTVVSISDFGEEGRDVLDLRDLLIGEEADDNAGLGNYLSVTSDGTDTVIEVSSTGEFTNGDTSNVHVDQTITLEGLDLVGSDDLSVVIQNMLESGQLITD